MQACSVHHNSLIIKFYQISQKLFITEKNILVTNYLSYEDLKLLVASGCSNGPILIQFEIHLPVQNFVKGQVILVLKYVAGWIHIVLL
jgi:hypothetical protein